MSRKGNLCQISTFPFYQQSAQGWLGWYVRVLLALPQQEPKMACKPAFTTPKPELQRWEGGAKNLGLKFFGLRFQPTFAEYHESSSRLDSRGLMRSITPSSQRLRCSKYVQRCVPSTLMDGDSKSRVPRQE